MSRLTPLHVAACLVAAALVRAVSGQEPTPAGPRFEPNQPAWSVSDELPGAVLDARSAAPTASHEAPRPKAQLAQPVSYSAVVPVSGESAGPALNLDGQGTAAGSPRAYPGAGSASGIPGYSSVRYPTTAFPSQAPPPEPKGPPPNPAGPPEDAPPGLLDQFQSLYHDGIEPMVDGTTEWLGENLGNESMLGPPKWGFHGWANAGTTWNPDYPNNRLNTPVGFNDRANEPQLNQLYAYVERRVDPNGCTWDYGARMDVIFGTDRRFMSSTGLELQQNNAPKWNSGTYYGVAMPQLYAEISAPVANGLTIKGGHFYSIFGFERLMAPDNFFYSHSYARIYGMPATHTGGMATLYLPPNLFFRCSNAVLMTGITQGWDTWGHQNKDLSWLSGFMIDSDDLGMTFSGALIAGQEPIANTGPGVPFGTGPFRTQDRWGWNLILSKQITDKLGYVAETVGGSQNAGVSTTIAGVTTTSPATWYGLCNYLIYEVNDVWAGALRFEWFHDQDYYRVQRTPTEVAGGFPFNNHEYFAFTMGLNYRPKPNILIRPEMRWDWSDIRGNPNVTASTIRVFDDASDGSQFLMATDVIISY